ncbi:MAG TPA: hypothetical protein VFA46_01495 [Actinomycetes bacterium]|nr:hypothetical protein [Actinomycetes bacterium]
MVDAGPGDLTVVGSDRSDVLALWQQRYSLVKPRVDREVRDVDDPTATRTSGASITLEGT